MRTGIGSERIYGAAEVAKTLGVSLTREFQIERQAVEALRTAAADRSCAHAPLPRATAPPWAVPAEPLVTWTPAPAASRVTAGRSHARHKVREPRRASRSRRAVKAAKARLSLPLATPSSSFSSPMLVALIFAGALIVLLVLVLRGATVRPSTASVRLSRWLGGAQGELVERRGAGGRPGAASGAAAAALRAAVAAAGGSVEAQDAVTAAVDARRATGRGAAARGDCPVVDERQEAAAASDAGVLYAERGDVRRALEAFRYADEHGDAIAASNLGVLLERQGNINGALAAYRRAAQRGDADGALHLGSLLADRDDVDGAIEAYRRARGLGDREVARAAQAALRELIGDRGRG